MTKANIIRLPSIPPLPGELVLAYMRSCERTVPKYRGDTAASMPSAGD
jgi:hypothetical protein